MWQHSIVYRGIDKPLNQPPPFEGTNLFDSDPALQALLRPHLDASALEHLSSLGAQLGSAESYELGRQANRSPPELQTHDRFGYRVDQVEFHPAWHRIMGMEVREGLHNRPWVSDEPGRYVHRAGAYYLFSQIEQGSLCPITMTTASVASLRHCPSVLDAWRPALMSTSYDPSFAPVAGKRGALMGMAMTEKQGGSDVRSNVTTATPLGATGPGEAYRLNGHKWFCSAPMCDAFLVLAQAPGGLSCLLVPRFRPDDTPNPFFIQRLKDKLGNRSNASSEIEFHDTYGVLISEEGRGVRTIIDMVHHTRLDCVIGSAALIRQAVAQAVHHARHRAAFGKKLVDQDLMRNVLADLALESEAAAALAVRLSLAFEQRGFDEHEDAFGRIATAISKFWVCKRAPWSIYESMECLGGGGYVEESILPRLYREAPVNAIWEGSGNVICLDVRRAFAREPSTRDALYAELERARGQHPRYDKALERIDDCMSPEGLEEKRLRISVSRLATMLQASLLMQSAPGVVADAFCESRLAAEPRHVFGMLPPTIDLKPIVDRALAA